MPGAAVRIEVGVGRLRKTTMCVTARFRWRCPIDGGPEERVSERDPHADVEEALGLRRPGRLHRDRGSGRRTPQQRGVTERFRGSEQEKLLRRRRQLRHPPSVRGFDVAGMLDRQSKATSEALDRHGMPRLEKRQRIAPSLLDDPVADALIDRTDRPHGEQLEGIHVGQSAQPDLRKPGEDVRFVMITQPEHQQHGIGVDPPPDERQGLRRRTIQPLRVVHEADERLELRGVRQEPEDSEADEEAVGRRPRYQAERRPESIALRRW